MADRARWTTRRLADGGAPDVGVTVHQLDSGVPGPHVLVLGGVHGDEVGGIVAAGRVATADWPLLTGRLSVVPVTHEAAHAADSRVSPLDGLNLARAFPGDRHGTPTERLAALVAGELIAHADVLIDLHTSNSAADMPLFVGCLDDGSRCATRAVELALAFGLPLIWTHPALGPGRTLTLAAARGVPALYVESPRGGVLDAAFLAAYVSGVRSVLEAAGQCPAGAARPAPTRWVHGSGDTDTFTAVDVPGLFLREVELLQTVARGDRIGSILSPLGGVLAAVEAPIDGVVTTLQRAAVVRSGQPLVGVTPPRPARLGQDSDRLFTARWLS